MPLGASQWIKLNVGGKPFLTTLETLMTYPDSLLAKMFDPESGFQPPYSENGVYFLDADPVHFGIILNWLRYRKIMAPSDIDMGTLAHIADYYGIVELIEALPPSPPVGRWTTAAAPGKDVLGMLLKIPTDDEPCAKIIQLPDGKLSVIMEDSPNRSVAQKCFTSDEKGRSVWVPTTAGKLPPRAIGFEGKDGEKLYLGRRLWVAGGGNEETSRVLPIQVFGSEGREPVIPHNAIISLGYVNEDGVWDIHFSENVDAILELSYESQDLLKLKEHMKSFGVENEGLLCNTSDFEVLCIF